MLSSKGNMIDIVLNILAGKKLPYILLSLCWRGTVKTGQTLLESKSLIVWAINAT